MKTEKDVVSVLSALDTNVVELEDVERLLQLFDEILWNEVSNIDTSQPWTAACFKGRFDMVYSTLSVIRIRLHDVLKEIRGSVAKGYESRKSDKEAPA